MESIEILKETSEPQNKGNKNKSFKFKYLTQKDKQTIKIFGTKFVENNLDKCNLIIDDNINCELRDKYTFIQKGEHTISLVINEENINFNSIFSYPNNTNLIDVFSLENLDTSECVDLSFMFCGCQNIKDFNFVKNWDVSKCKNFNGIFIGCSFQNLDFLKNWKTSKATSLEYMFSGRKNLNDITGIKNWNVERVENFHSMFLGCESLFDVNDLQNWNMNKAKDIRLMFARCQNLISADSLYKWKLNDYVNREQIFEGCNKLINVPRMFENYSCSIY